MSFKEQVAHDLDSLSEAELKQVAEYLAFLRFRSRLKSISSLSDPNEAQLANLYAEFAAEDRKLAEEGMTDYAEGLIKEDCRG